MNVCIFDMKVMVGLNHMLGGCGSFQLWLILSNMRWFVNRLEESCSKSFEKLEWGLFRKCGTIVWLKMLWSVNWTVNWIPTSSNQPANRLIYCSQLEGMGEAPCNFFCGWITTDRPILDCSIVAWCRIELLCICVLNDGIGSTDSFVDFANMLVELDI